MTEFDRHKGERIEGLPERYVVAPNSRWTDSPMFADAAKHAAAAFAQSGALHPVFFSADDILVQEYPDTYQVAFIFARKIAGKPYFYPFVYDLPPEMVAWLKNAGRWGYNH